MSEAPLVVVTTHCLDRALARLGFELAGAVGAIKREVREGLAAGRVSAAKPPAFSAPGRTPAQDWQGALFVWPPDGSRAWVVVERADEGYVVKTVLLSRRRAEVCTS